MKLNRWMIFVLCIAFLFSVAGAEEDYETYQLGNTSYQVPSSWLIKDSDDGKSAYYYAQKIGSVDGGYLYVSLGDLDATQINDLNAESTYQEFANALFTDDAKVSVEYLSYSIIGRAQGHVLINGEEMLVSAVLYTHDSDLLVMTLVNNDLTPEELDDAMTEFADRINGGRGYNDFKAMMDALPEDTYYHQHGEFDVSDTPDDLKDDYMNALIDAVLDDDY